MSVSRETYLKSLPRWLSARIGMDHWAIRGVVERAGRSAPQDGYVLDAGAGECKYASFFDRARYVAVDFARGDSAWDYGRLSVIGELDRLPVAEAMFDVAICTQVLEHVREPGLVLDELARALRPGGQLFVSAPQWWFEHQKPHDYFRYTSFGLRHLFERSGFEVVSVAPIGGYFWFLSVVLQGLHSRLFPDAGPAWLRYLLRLPRMMTQVLFWTLVPVILYYLDRLDTQREFTLGYVCHCVKPGNSA
jgi:SAM-dependent methyltransferase